MAILALGSGAFVMALNANVMAALLPYLRELPEMAGEDFGNLVGAAGLAGAIGAFLLGALPFWVMARATRWRLKRRLDNTERALVAATAAPTPTALASAAPAISAAPLASDAAPLPAADPLPSTSNPTGPA